MSNFRYRFTVLTPSYNRRHTLERVYQSLQAQSLRDFEWLIIDDGSTDDTRARVQAWQREAPFPVHYHWQENQHKKAAFNRGVRCAQGEWVVVLDSDDSLVPDALRDMAAIIDDIGVAERERYVGVIGLCARPDGSIVGDRFPQDVLDASALDLTYRYRVRGEKSGCLSTTVLRRFPFPESVPGFVPESLVWRAMARAGYRNRFVNQVFRIYYDSSDSLSHQGRTSARHALGLWLLARDTVQECLPWFRHDPLAFLLAAARYTRFWLHSCREHPEMIRQHRLRGVWPRLLVAFMALPGGLLYLRDRWRARRHRQSAR